MTGEFVGWFRDELRTILRGVQGVRGKYLGGLSNGLQRGWLIDNAGAAVGMRRRRLRCDECFTFDAD